MTDLDRDIGVLEARMDDHDRRFDKLEEQMDAGFEGINRKLDGLRLAESRRKGAMSVLKLLFGGGTLAGLWELAKTWIHK